MYEFLKFHEKVLSYIELQNKVQMLNQSRLALKTQTSLYAFDKIILDKKYVNRTMDIAEYLKELNDLKLIYSSIYHQQALDIWLTSYQTINEIGAVHQIKVIEFLSSSNVEMIIVRLPLLNCQFGGG